MDPRDDPDRPRDIATFRDIGARYRAGRREADALDERLTVAIVADLELSGGDEPTWIDTGVEAEFEAARRYAAGLRYDRARGLPRRRVV